MKTLTSQTKLSSELCHSWPQKSSQSPDPTFSDRTNQEYSKIQIVDPPNWHQAYLSLSSSPRKHLVWLSSALQSARCYYVPSLALPSRHSTSCTNPVWRDSIASLETTSHPSRLCHGCSQIRVVQQQQNGQHDSKSTHSPCWSSPIESFYHLALGNKDEGNHYKSLDSLPCSVARVLLFARGNYQSHKVAFWFLVC